MINSSPHLAQCLQQSYTDNAGKRRRVGKRFRAAIEAVDYECEARKIYCEPVQLVEFGAQLITTKFLIDIGEFVIIGLTLSGENQKLRTSVFYDDAENCIKIELDHGIDFGYFTLEFDLFDGVQRERITQLIIVAPLRAWGGQFSDIRNVLAVQLYALRSSSNWGIGDFGDLKKLAEKAGKAGYQFIALNPMHMTHFDQLGECSPYSPVSRLLLNWLYIDIPALEIYDREKLINNWPFEGEFIATLARLRDCDHVDYEKVAAIKFWVLSLLSEHFWEGFEQADASNPDYQVFSKFLSENQRTIARQVNAHGGGVNARDRNLRFHLFTQFCCAVQLEQCFALENAAKPIYDLAIGVKPDSLEVRACPQDYVASMSIGAPPDAFNQLGQCWNIAPFNPITLREKHYRPLVELLRANMPFGGGIRIDHVMWLARQYWMADGSTALEGGYVRFPVDEILAILRLESRRRHCIIIGEDLGTVPRGFRAKLTGSGIYLMDVLPFSISDPADLEAMSNYSPRVAAFIGTHDMPLFAAIWSEQHANILHKLKLFSANEMPEIGRLIQRQKCVIAGLIGEELPICEAGQAFRLLGRKLKKRKPEFYFTLLDDLLGEVMPINIPGTIDEYPNWRRKHSIWLENLQIEMA